MQPFYFAYGSNMSTPRLRERIPEAEPAGAAWVDGYRLTCNKLGKDGSGKANLVPSAGDAAWGVLFSGFADTAWTSLDRFEWGYSRASCRVLTAEGQHVEARLYLALEPAEHEIPPFDWYRSHCLSGAVEHRLPEPVIETIRQWTVAPGAL